MYDLKGKCIVLGVSGGIAAYKAAALASALNKTGADVHVIMTENAARFISPLTFETLTSNRCVVDMFDRGYKYDVEHISLAKAADLIVIAPATANIIAKTAHGIADDMLTSVVLAAKCKKLVSPSMNTAMLENPVTIDNINTLRKYGFEIIPSAAGRLACGDIGSGKLPEPDVILEYIARELAREKTLSGLKVTVTAGPTQEAIDPVRFITNHSSGKMGYAIAKEAMLRGADVTLISGPVSIDPVPFTEIRRVVTAADMFSEVKRALPHTDILIMSAAVADFRPSSPSADKIKKSGSDSPFSVPLKHTDDILKWVSENRHEGLFVCGFSMETRDLEENSRSKLTSKKLDMIAANDLREEGAGFGVDTNILTVITKSSAEKLPLMSKEEAAAALTDRIEDIIFQRQRHTPQDVV